MRHFFIIVGVSRKSFIMLLTFMCEKQCLEQGCKWEEGGWSEKSVNSVMLLGLMSHRWCSLCEKAGYSRSDTTPGLTFPRVPSRREGMSCHLVDSDDHTQNKFLFLFLRWRGYDCCSSIQIIFSIYRGKKPLLPTAMSVNHSYLTV